MVTLLLVIYVGLMLMHTFVMGRDLVKHKSDLGKGNWFVSGIIGFVTDFLDTLGIGSFAPTAMLLDFTKQLGHDRLLPGTLNVAHAIPVLVEAFIFTTVVEVSPVTLFSLIIAATVGSFVGSKFVTKLPEKKVQFWMGWALIITAVLMGLRQTGMLNMLGEGNTATALTGAKLVIGVVVNFILGALMTIGVGLYAPCMAMVYMLGLSPLVAFPVMMGSCAGLMPVASINFVKEGDYARKVSLAITIGGIIGVIIAAKFVTGLNLDILTWIIIVVIVYTGITYILKSRKPAVAVD
ncbi:TSUP family transporter [Enterococcus dongliensis]|uniref:TSUP family transporter n=1 Tax=Enterococcus dongliensis TaxID=2559925 RepID=A0AAW8TJJ4_9ENTE|nr:TSUP family transporter [Enterococcus dongliensis]MDT2597252.1 TSUP family transporter [Enterococcus dongliensis]MDT2603994.1 TSUP family transporter [Enterococcus dongliensis]MDT2634886.1 TSUP family transporter [Enterococcus dongliensis]MDT2638031.1 TSUP family transporter [Enterococcus dongliensis]MDT2638682.1 TSUP family transporter [Enterococcus dongliensis]